jgi:hypothetical protein
MEVPVLAKKTVKNQINIPKAIVEQFPSATRFEVRVEAGEIVLRPVAHAGEAARVRGKLRELAISEADVREAVRWTRSHRP